MIRADGMTVDGETRIERGSQLVGTLTRRTIEQRGGNSEGVIIRKRIGGVTEVKEVLLRMMGGGSAGLGYRTRKT